MSATLHRSRPILLALPLFGMLLGMGLPFLVMLHRVSQAEAREKRWQAVAEEQSAAIERLIGADKRLKETYDSLVAACGRPR